MEQQIINNYEAILTDEVINLSSLKPGSDKCFIEANTIQSCLEEIKNDHIIPVFIKDNNTLISHSDFVETTMEMVQKYYDGETILSPNIRMSPNQRQSSKCQK